MSLISGAKRATALVYEYQTQKNRLREVILFATFALILPLVLSVIIAIVEPNYGAVYKELVAKTGAFVVTSAQRSLVFANGLIIFLLPLTGLVLQAIVGFTRLVSLGYLFFYLFFIVPGLLSLFGASALVVFWVSNGINALLFVLYVFLVPSVRRSLVLLIRIRSVALMVLAGIVIYAFTFGLGVAGSSAFPTTSDNQKGLMGLSSVQTIVSAILIAPFVEEFVIRRTIMTNFSGNWVWRLFGAVIACFFFAFLHIRATNDWQHLVVYLLPSVPLTLGTFLLRNAFPSSLGHLLSNLTVFLLGR